jgi:hypothetical protein
VSEPITRRRIGAVTLITSLAESNGALRILGEVVRTDNDLTLVGASSRPVARSASAIALAALELEDVLRRRAKRAGISLAAERASARAVGRVN